MTDLAKIRLVITDVDGVLTDGSVYVDADGRETCRYSKRDGVLLPVMREAGIEVVALTAEADVDYVTRDYASIKIGPRNPHQGRFDKLGIPLRGCLPDGKLSALKAITEEGLHIPLSEVCYIGDDLPDLPCLEAVAEAGGLAVIPYDAAEDVMRVAVRDEKWEEVDGGSREVVPPRFHVTPSGGHGCLRDVCERLLKARGYDLGVWPPVRR